MQEAQVTIKCVIPQKCHRTVMGSKGHKVQEITKDHDVNIKFPERPAENDGIVNHLFLPFESPFINILLTECDVALQIVFCPFAFH